MRTLLHVSDLHFGKTDPLVIAKLLEAAIRAKPDIVIITGDLTQRARIEQFEHMQAFLGVLTGAGIKYFVIPGNHDIRPIYRPIARAFKPYDRYRKYVTHETEPRYADKEVAIGSIDTVRRGKIANGKIGKRQIHKLQSWFSAMDEDVTRIVVTHHPLHLPRSLVRPLVRRAKHAVYGLDESRIDLYLAGHYHRSSVSSMKEKYGRLKGQPIAVQAGTVSTRGRGEAQSFNIITLESPYMEIDTYLLDNNGKFTRAVSKRFVRKDGLWLADS